MSKYTVLHITDAHFGQPSMAGQWPSLKAQFFADLAHVVEQTGGVDLVAFTGDIANRGAESEYAQAAEFIEALGEFFLTNSDTIPRFTAVPGNHDLTRPTGSSLAKAALEREWGEEYEKMLFGDLDPNDLRDFTVSLFDNYSNWMDMSSHALTPIQVQHRGILPGDFAATDTSNGFKVGIIGVNSTFRHISDAASEGTLTISPHQVQLASGGDMPAWSHGHDIAIALTHHPMSWIKNPANIEDALFNSASTTRLHLCGHLHLENYSLQAPGTHGGRLTHQGQSLFGIEQFSGPSGHVDRQHGYALITLEKKDGKISTTLWPRKAEKLNDGTWGFDRHAGFGLPRASENSLPIDLYPAKTPAVARRGTYIAKQTTPQQPLEETGNDPITNFLHEFKRGFMVAVIGDRFLETEEGIGLGFERFRQHLWEALDTGEPLDTSLSIDQLYELSRDYSEAATQKAVATDLGTPPQSAIDQLDRILKTPWANVIYLSPLRDLEMTPSIASQDSTMSVIDGTLMPYRLPDPDSSYVLRLTGPAPQDGSLTLRLDEVLSRSPENFSSDWRLFAKQILSRSPSVFLADSVSSLSLWQWIADRSSAPSNYQMASFLVCPDLPERTHLLLKRYNVQWINSSISNFVDKYLTTSRVEYVAAKTAVAKRRRGESGQTPLAIGALRSTSDTGSRNYLLGSSPTWGDVTHGFAARLSSQQTIMQKVNVALPGTTILVTGTAGSGRTTSLMQCALDLQAAHKSVAWVNPAGGREKISDIVNQVIEDDYEYIFVDDVDLFGAQAERLISGLRGGQNSKRIVIAGVRSVRAFLVEGISFSDKIAVGNLTSLDLDGLVKVLRDHRAVANRRQSNSELRKLLVDAKGQLIVGMIGATSGVPFADKIISECKQLSPSALIMYGCAALVTAENEAIAVTQLQDAVGGNANDSWRTLKSLEDSQLLQMQPNTGRYEVRHRVIAEAVRDYLAKIGALATVTMGTVHAYAAAGALTRNRSNHSRRLLIRLINHSYLIRTLGLAESKIRDIYDSVEDILEDDFHYWLQRGAFEVEHGDLRNAMHDLTSANTTVGGEDDPRVLTEFAVLRLKIASGGRTSDAITLSISAIEDLHKVIRIQGVNAPHTFSILASTGVTWLVDALISRSEKKNLAEETLRVLKTAGTLVTTNPQVAQAVPPAIKTLEELIPSL
jgi:predicted MPP superfamily phosphohydrolase